MSAPLPELVTVIVPVFTVRVAGVLTSDAGDPENPTIACVPVPLRAKVCAGAPLLTVRVAVRAPTADGVNVTLIVQVELGATFVPQVLVCAKFEAFVPVIAMLVITNAPVVELFLSVTACAGVLVVFKGWFPKLPVKGATGVRVADVEAAMPEPVSVAVSAGLRPAPLTVAVTELELTVVGLNVTLIVQFAPAARVPVQVPPAACANGAGIVTVMAVRATVPVLFNVSASGALVVATVWFPKANGEGEIPTTGATMVPVRATGTTVPVPMFTFNVAVFAVAGGTNATVGVKVTLIVQAWPGCTVPQLFVWVNCVRSVPQKLILPLPQALLNVSERAVLPVFVTVTG